MQDALPRSVLVALPCAVTAGLQEEPGVPKGLDLDDALLAGTSPLRLVHGKGTGMLGRGLQEHLRDHPAVKSFRYGNEEEGSTGVTLIELRS